MPAASRFRRWVNPWGQLVQISGSILILASFGLAQLQKLSTRSRPYLTLNLAGSAILAAGRGRRCPMGLLLLEGAWALVSLLGLALTACGGAGWSGGCDRAEAAVPSLDRTTPRPPPRPGLSWLRQP